MIPLVWNVYLSFTEYRGIRPPEWIGLDNWIELVGDAVFWTSFGNSIAMIVAMVVVPDPARPAARRHAVRPHRQEVRRHGSRASCAPPTTCRRSCPRVIAGDRDRLDPAPAERRAQPDARGGRPRARCRTTGSATPTPRCQHHGDHGLGAARLPDRHLHGRAAARRPRALRGGRARRRELVPALPRDHRRHHPARDLRRDAHLHDRRAEGLRARSTPSPAAGRAPRRSCPRTTRTASSSSRSRSATAPPSRPRSRRHRRGQRGVHPVAEPRASRRRRADDRRHSRTDHRAPLEAADRTADAGEAGPRVAAGAQAHRRRLGRAGRGDPARPAHRRAVPAHPHQLVQVAGRLQHVGPAVAADRALLRRHRGVLGAGRLPAEAVEQRLHLGARRGLRGRSCRCSTPSRSASGG